MGRSRGHSSRGKNKASLPQVPKNLKEEKHEEFSNELSLEVQARANAANQRTHNNKHQTFK